MKSHTQFLFSLSAVQPGHTQTICAQLNSLFSFGYNSLVCLIHLNCQTWTYRHHLRRTSNSRCPVRVFAPDIKLCCVGGACQEGASQFTALLASGMGGEFWSQLFSSNKNFLLESNLDTAKYTYHQQEKGHYQGPERDQFPTDGKLTASPTWTSATTYAFHAWLLSVSMSFHGLWVTCHSLWPLCPVPLLNGLSTLVSGDSF